MNNKALMNIGICTSCLRQLSLQDIIWVAKKSNLKMLDVCAGNNRLVDINNYKQSIDNIKTILNNNLTIDILNSYYPIDDFNSLTLLIRMAQELKIKKIRVVMPQTDLQGSEIYRSSLEEHPTCFPGSETNNKNFSHILRKTKRKIKDLNSLGKSNGIVFLIETHWATVMSSFLAAFYFFEGIPNQNIRIIWDPANMYIEGKEDFQMGLSLLNKYIDTTHVKNISWQAVGNRYMWAWAPLNNGSVNWDDTIRKIFLYKEDMLFKIEDFTLLKCNRQESVYNIMEITNKFNNR